MACLEQERWDWWYCASEMWKLEKMWCNFLCTVAYRTVSYLDGSCETSQGSLQHAVNHCKTADNKDYLSRCEQCDVDFRYQLTFTLVCKTGVKKQQNGPCPVKCCCLAHWSFLWIANFYVLSVCVKGFYAAIFLVLAGKHCSESLCCMAACWSEDCIFGSCQWQSSSSLWP